MKKTLLITAAFCVAVMTALAKDEKVKASDLPEAVTKAVKAAYPEGSIKEAEKETVEGKIVYEIDVQVGDEEHELKITAAGEILKPAKDEEDDDEAGEDNDEDKDDDDGGDD